MKFQKFLSILAISSIVGLSLVACGGSSTDDSSSQTQNEESDTEVTEGEDSEAAVEPKSEYAVGETVDVDGKQLTALEISRSQGSEFDSPKDGNEFVIVTVKYDNQSEKDMSYNPYDFELLNSQGQKTDMAFTTINSDTSLESGELAPGGTVTGTIAFEAPAGDEGLYLIYTENMFSDKEVKIKL